LRRNGIPSIEEANRGTSKYQKRIEGCIGVVQDHRRNSRDRDDRGGQAVRESTRLRKIYGGKRWRKLKGIATVELSDGWTGPAEVHWYEAHGVGRQEIKIKRFLE